MSEIDNLKLNFTANSGGVSKSINDLKNSLSKLKTATSGGVGLSKISSELNGLVNATNRLSNYGVQNITNLVNALQSFKNLKDLKISSSISNQINKLTESAQKLSGANLNPIVKLGEALKSLDMSGIKITTTPVKLVEGIVKVVKELEQADLSTLAPKVREFTDALRSMENFKATGMSSLLNALNKLPNIEKSLRNINLDAFSQDVKELSGALAPLAAEFVKIGNVLDRIPTKFKATKQAMQKTIAASNGFISSAGSFITPLNAIQTAFAKAYTYANRVITPLAKMVGLTNQYVEDMNLFSVSLGKYAEEAYGYAQQVSDILGIDPGQFMRNEGLFMTLADGFGVASDRAFVMSQNLTQLGYDLSSFFNISVSDAMAKLQSGLAGELEPLRRIGYDLSKARLEAEALALGITKTYNEMTQAEKAQLRYHVIMTQVTQAQGDMARTLTAPANQLRVLQAQLIMAGRAIGSIFIPMLNAILPFAIAAVKVIRMLADAIAGLFGAKLPDVDFNAAQSKMPQIETPEIDKASDASGKLSDNLKDNKKKAEELKATILSFDQLHILNPQNKDSLDELAKKLPGGSGIEGLDDVGGWSDFDLPTYDFLEGALDSNIDKIISSWRKKLKPFWDWIKNNLDIIKNLIISTGAGFLTWKLSNAFMGDGGLGGLIATLKNWFKMNKIPIGLTLMVSGFTLASLGAYSIGYDGLNWKNLLQNIIGNALGVMGTLLVFGTGPLGWTVALGLAFIVNAISFILGRNARIRDDDLKKRFGNLHLTDEQLGEWVNNITSTVAIKSVRLMMDKNAKVIVAQDEIQRVVDGISSNLVSIKLGIDVSKDEVMSNVESLVQNASDYLENSSLELKLSLGGREGTQLGGELLTFLDEMYATTKGAFEEKAKQLKDAFSKAWSDKGWDLDALKEAQKLQKELLEITEAMRDFDFKASLNSIGMELEVDGSIINYESFTKIQNKMNAEITDNIKLLQELSGKQKAIIDLEYEQKLKENPADKDKLMAERNKRMREVEQWFLEDKLELVMEVGNFQLGRVQEAWSDELDKVKPIVEKSASEIYNILNPGIKGDEMYKNIQDFIGGISEGYTYSFRRADIPGEVRENIKAILVAMEPTLQQMEALAQEYIKNGEVVPDSLLEGLTNAEKLKEIAGVPYGTSYLLLQGIHNDPNKEKIIQALKDAGTEQSNAILEAYKNTFGEGQPKVNKATNELVEEVTNAIEDGTPEAKGAMVNAAETLYNGFNSGIGNNFTYSKVGVALGGIWSNITSWWRQNTGTLGVNVGTKTIIGGGTRSGGIQMMATGGFPSTGQMFIAREAGPEMVGSIGGRTAVANNSQIVDAVSAGVAQAVSAVMGTGQGGDLVVQIKNPNEVTAREIYRQNLSTARREGRVRV